MYALAGATQVLLMTVAVWILAADSIRDSAVERRTLLFAGVFLVGCWASAALAANMGGPPGPAAWTATRADQHVR